MKSPRADLQALMDRLVQPGGSTTKAAGTSLNADDPSTSRKDR
jgi:hypothetical protein